MLHRWRALGTLLSLKLVAVAAAVQRQQLSPQSSYTHCCVQADQEDSSSGVNHSAISLLADWTESLPCTMFLSQRR